MLVAAILFAIGWPKTAVLFMLIGIFCAYFFRDPNRNVQFADD
jgi:uncharacterized membrane protein